MLEYNEIIPKKYIVLDGEPYKVISSHVFRKQQRKPVNQTKLKNLITGRVLERSFHQSEKVREVDIEKHNVIYLYNNRGQWWFCAPDDRSNRFSIDESIVGKQGRFLKENTPVIRLTFDDKTIGFQFPVKVDLIVTEAPPAVRGNTSQGGIKQITLETGAVINAPLFINIGDTVRVNTETGEYVERVGKK
jgi:elongation factor P